MYSNIYEHDIKHECCNNNNNNWLYNIFTSIPDTVSVKIQIQNTLTTTTTNNNNNNR